MSKLKLSQVPNGVSNTVTNTNFGKIEKELNENVLKRRTEVGEDNAVHTDIDMNSNRIYNLPKPEREHEPLRRKDVLDAISATEDARDAANKANDAVDRVNNMEEDFQKFLLSSGYQDLGDYEAGLEITARNQVFRKDGEMYRASASLDIPYTTTGDWDSEKDYFVALGDAVLRQDLANPTMGAALIGFQQDGVDAIIRTALDKMKDIIDVKDFGAVGDGVTDDTLAIQNAASSLGPGQMLKFSGGGVYLISDSIVLPENTGIEMGKSVLKQPPGVHFSMIRVSRGNILQVNLDGTDYDEIGTRGISGPTPGEVHDLIVYNSTIKNVQNGIRADGAHRCLFYNNHISRTRNSGILIGVWDGHNALHNILMGNTFEDMGDTAIAFFSNTSNAEVAYNTIIGNVAKDTQRITGGYAFDFEGGQGEYKHHNAIVNNIVEQTRLTGFDQHGITMARSEYGIVSGNIVKGNNAPISHGISIRLNKNTIVTGNQLSDLSVGITARGASSCKISNNILTDCGRDSQIFPAINIISFNQEVPTLDIEVSGNSIDYTQATTSLACGIAIRTSAGGSKNWTIKGNTLKKLPGYGIYIAGEGGERVTGVSILDNNFYGERDEARPAIFLSQADYSVVKGNILRDPFRGMHLIGCNHTWLEGNYIAYTKEGHSSKYYIILGKDNGDPSQNTLIENNYFSGSTATYPLGPPGDVNNPTTVIRNNVGFITESQGLITGAAPGIEVQHGLDVTPSFVQITPFGGIAEGLYVDGINSSSFRIKYSGNATSFFWKAERG